MLKLIHYLHFRGVSLSRLGSKLASSKRNSVWDCSAASWQVGFRTADNWFLRPSRAHQQTARAATAAPFRDIVITGTLRSFKKNLMKIKY
jgi:hypothetical protein